MTLTELETGLTQAGYPNFVRDSQTRLILYTTDDRKQTLLLLAKSFPRARYLSQKNGPGWKSSAGAVTVDGFMILAKPAKAGLSGSLGQLDARVFTSLAKKGTFAYHGTQVPRVTFTDYKVLEKSILLGIKSTPILGNDIAEVIEDFFAKGYMNWRPGFPQLVINKLGVYVGELLIGWVYLKNVPEKFVETNPFKKRVVAFHLPTDPAFSGVDSFLETADKKHYAVSSKLGTGAKASFFSNVLKQAMERMAKLDKSVLKDLCELMTKNHLVYKDARASVYLYGVRKILKISERDIPRPYAVYDQIKAKKLGPEARQVILAIRAFPGMKQEFPIILQKLPNSVSAFMNRQFAKRMNEDVPSQEQVADILAGKDYWQANLKLNLWLKGHVKFTMLRSGKADVNFIGNKSSTEDISSSQGWVNYELKYTR